MTITRKQVRGRVYRLPEFADDLVGFESTATGTGTTGIPDTRKFGPTQVGEFQYADGWGYVPTLTGAEISKRMGAISGTTLLHADNANWANVVNGTAYEWLAPNLHPDTLNRFITEAMRELYAYSFLPISPWPDGTMEDSGTSNWTAGNATLSKVTTTANGRVGSRSLLITNTAALGHAFSPTGIYVQPKQRWQLDALAIPIAEGPVQWRLFDFTGGVLGDELAAPAIGYGLTPILLRQSITVPAGCYRIICRMQNDHASGITAWDALPGRKLSDRNFVLDSYAKAGFNITGLSEALGYVPLSEGNNAYDATTQYFEGWKRGPDYQTEHYGANATPNLLRIERDPRNISRDTQLWVSTRRPWGDVDPLDSEESSEVPDDQIVYAVAAKVAAHIGMPDVAAKYSARVMAETQARPPTTSQPRRQHYGGRLGP